MEEADKLLLESLRLIEVNVSTLEELDSNLFINTLISCFGHISKLLTKEDNFIDVRYLRS
jgi:hypothetical protein